MNLVDILSIDPTIDIDIRYATENNFLHRPLYTQAVCYLHFDVATALHRVQQEARKRGLSLKIFDGYRPLHVQVLMWEAIRDERYVSNPYKSRGRHTRGTAVDLTLLNSLGQELKMPSQFDEFSEQAYAHFEDLSQEANRNGALLKALMEHEGFIAYPFEWWHFDFSGWNDDAKYPALDLSFETINASEKERKR